MQLRSHRILFCLFSLATGNAFAIDSYRYVHVTIDTPWTIFLFLLGFIFAPFVLMGILVWRYSEKKSNSRSPKIESDEQSQEERSE
jgi:hypothetical protein